MLALISSIAQSAAWRVNSRVSPFGTSSGLYSKLVDGACSIAATAVDSWSKAGRVFATASMDPTFLVGRRILVTRLEFK
jgi:hypothetical protein